MNRKGQTLVIFIIIFPVFLILMALIVDIGLIQLEQRKLNQVTELLLQDYYDYRMDANILELVENGFGNNQIDVSNLKVNGTDDFFQIENQTVISSVFGKLLGFQNYSISVSYQLSFDQGKKQIVKG